MSQEPQRLARVVGPFGATMLGLGAMVGSGVFVSLALATGLAGTAVIPAIGVAAALAYVNAINTAQLAAVYPVSGGTYEYAYRQLHPLPGFVAGWMFISAKTASAATAALGFAQYFAAWLPAGANQHQVGWALAAVAALTLLVLAGVRRSTQANTIIVSITLLSLLAFILGGLPSIHRQAGGDLHAASLDGESVRRFLQASALMFVAFTGYGRVATLGEEIIDPLRSIPKAVRLSVLIAGLLYAAVVAVALGAIGSERFAATLEEGAPLAVVSRELSAGWVARLVSIGAITAMLGVLLNLILGISRVVLAMGRRRDLPAMFGRLDSAERTPRAAVIVTALVIGLIVLKGDIKLAWSLSAFTVLVYYAITNLASLRVRGEDRFVPRWTAIVGLAGCLGLASFIDRAAWQTGMILIAAGVAWWVGARWIRRDYPSQ